jgi:hypothetical protein
MYLELSHPIKGLSQSKELSPYQFAKKLLFGFFFRRFSCPLNAIAFSTEA